MAARDAEPFTAEALADTKRDRIRVLSRADTFPSAVTNTMKEELCLEYVENFRKQFVDLFPRRRALLLTAPNEAGIDKFVCTTIRPTQLRFRDMYDYRRCAQFLADFIQYEPLPDPTAPPAHLPSPLAVLNWRVGDCFDMSVLLTSYLVGNGYDAYCVYGTAPRRITLRDTSRDTCPFVEAEWDVQLGLAAATEEGKDGGDDTAGESGDAAAGASAESKSKYAPQARASLKSSYLEAMEERQRKMAAEESAKAAGEDAPAAPELEDETPKEAPDALAGRRVHCWVLIRAGRRDIDRHVFVEPSTGRVYDVEHSPYESVEALWNHQNFWVNMQSELLLPDAKDAGAASESKAHDVPVPVAAAVRDGGDAADGDAADGDAAGAPESKLADGDAADTTVEPEVPAHPPSRLAQKHAEALAAGTRRAGAGAASAGAGADAAAGGMASDIAAFADGSVAALSFDLSNNDNWEYVFINTAAAALPQAGTGVGAGAGAGAAAGEEEELGRIDLDTGLPLNAEEAAEADAEAAAATGADDGGEHVLDLPPSWVPKLVLDRDLYELRYSPAGSRTTVFHKTKLEQYAPFVHPEGMLQRCTFYENVARTQVHRVVEVFGNRTDKLVKRVRLLLDQLVQEYFAPGRPSGLRLSVEHLGKSREMHFFVSARIDYLEKRTELIGKKIIEWYKEGPDSKLLYRSATLMPAAEAEAFAARQARASAGGKGAAKVANLPTLVSAAGELPIVKMTEKFARSPDKPAELDEARRTFLLEDQAIQVQYHHAPGRITASSRLYTKHNSGVELTTVDPFAPPLTAPQLDADFRAAVQAEKDCISAVKTQQRAVADILKTRKRQEASALLEKSMFDLALERAKSGPTDDDADTADEVGDKPFDFLAPFLQFVQDPKNITRAEADRADKACRKALRQRLLERANIIQRRLDEENEMLQKKQQEFQRNRDQVEGAEEEFEAYASACMFRIGILEQRLQRQEELACDKFAELEQQLKTDPRLAVKYRFG